MFITNEYSISRIEEINVSHRPYETLHITGSPLQADERSLKFGHTSWFIPKMSVKRERSGANGRKEHLSKQRKEGVGQGLVSLFVRNNLMKPRDNEAKEITGIIVVY